MKNNLPVLQKAINSPQILDMIKTRLGEKAPAFITSILDLWGEDKNLAACNPDLVIQEALKSAALDLPINKNLGYAYVIPYKNIPQFQVGWKGWVQLCIRTGLYKYINPDIVYEGEEIIEDRIKGTFEIGGKRKNDKAIGFFCYFELINGFNKGIVWTLNEVIVHAKRFSKSYNSSHSPWKTDFNAMAKKTLLLQLLTKFGPATIEISKALAFDQADFKGFGPQKEIEAKANQEIIDIPAMSEEDIQDAQEKEILPEY